MRSDAAKIDFFRQQILVHWMTHGRHDLPWRKTRDPWVLLLTESTLRKTTAQQVAEIYPELAKLTPEGLASADPEEISALLRSLGFQRVRAHNLIQIAKAVVVTGRAALESEQFLRSLPGVGSYVTNAVRCNAFGVPVPTVDTNMIRIIGRVFGYESTRARPRDDQALWDFAAALVDPGHPREFNWGVLDFGAHVCRARGPECSSCPLKTVCLFCQSAAREMSNANAATTPLAADVQRSTPLTVVSLFSGAGGFDWGFHRAGYDTLLACELLPGAAQTLASNLKLKTTTPDSLANNLGPAVIQGNIEHIDFARIALQPDVLIGGPPCQDFSVSKAHERQGLNGGRGHLYREFVRAVMYFQPKMFVFENVPGLTSANRGQAFRTILSDLQHLEDKRKDCLGVDAPYSVPGSPVQNYRILFRNVVEAVRLGVPQIRRRLILLGLREDLHNALSLNNRMAIINGIEQKMYGANMLFARYPLTSIEVFEGKPLTELQSEYRRVMEEYKDVAEVGANNQRSVLWKRNSWDCLTFDVVHDYLALNQLNGSFSFNADEFEQAMQEHEQLLQHMGWLNSPVSKLQLPDGTHLPPKQSQDVVNRMYHIPPDANADFVAGTEWEVESKQISFIYRRTAPLKPAMTVMAYGGGGTHGYHYERTRAALSLRERARIQTFTDDFLFSGEHIRAQIGEAVPPLLGEHIATILRDVI